jgi:hypothetical protein
MFGSFTTRRNFGNQLFPSRTLGQFGGASSPIAGNFLSAAGITDPTISTAINQLVIDLLNNNLLSKFYAIYPFVGGSAFTCKFNLINSLDTNEAFRLNFVGGWTFSSNGALPNGVNSYADSFFSNRLFNNINNSFGVYSRTNNIITGTSIGAVDSAFIGHSIALKNTDNNTYFNNSDFVLNGNANFVTDTRGFFSVNRISSTQKIIYRNGINIRSSNFGIANYSGLNMFIGARNNNNTPALFDNKELSLAYLSDGFTPAEALIFYNIVQAFQTNLSRNV